VTGRRGGTDSGLQNERTSLAWRRTGLSLVVGAATMAKLTAGAWGGLATVWLLVGIPAGLVLLVGSSSSYRDRQADQGARTAGPAVVVVAATTAVLGLLAGAYLVA
jgi:uncharacterized membrane protein YidH (DUF202 family)